MKWLYSLVFVILSGTVLGQNREESWSKINVVKAVNAKWSIGVDFQYRTQADFRRPGIPNVFQYPLTTSFRTWLYYRLPKNWTIVYSPFALFSTSELSPDSQDFIRTNEVRSFIGGTKSFSFKGDLQSKNRLAYEFRVIKKEGAATPVQHRYRLQNAFTVPLFKWSRQQKLSLYMMNEIFLRTQNHTTKLDQNRSYVSLSFRYNQAEIVSGYQFVFQHGSKDDFYRNIWLTTLNITIP